MRLTGRTHFMVCGSRDNAQIDAGKGDDDD